MAGGREAVCDLRQIVLQKAMNRTPKGRLLQAERRPFANRLIVNGLQKGQLVFHGLWLSAWRLMPVRRASVLLPAFLF